MKTRREIEEDIKDKDDSYEIGTNEITELARIQLALLLDIRDMIALVVSEIRQSFESQPPEK